jgi:hypothetical protein
MDSQVKNFRENPTKADQFRFSGMMFVKHNPTIAFFAMEIQLIQESIRTVIANRH